MPLFNKCPIGCLSEIRATSVVLPEGPLLRCGNCGHLVSSCTYEEYVRALNKWNTTGGTAPDAHSEKRYRRVTSRRLKRALKLHGLNSERLHLLDVGCSSGALLGIASDMGFEALGVEPAEEAAKTAQQAGLNVFQGLLHEANYPAATFDVVTVFEVVEHILNPLELLKEAHRVMKTGGVLIINTPNSASWSAMIMKERWQGVSLTKMGGHISFFSTQSLTLLAQRSGLEVVRVETRNVRFCEKGQYGSLVYGVLKILAQLLALPARMTGRGHDLLIYLVKP